MRSVIAAARSWSDAPFRYIAGHVALDFVNTVDWTPAGLVEDRLGSYRRLVEWGVGANLLGRDIAERLHQQAERDSTRASRVVGDARRLRHAIRRLVLERLGPGSTDPSMTAESALGTLSGFVRTASAHRQLALVRRARAKRRAPGIQWVWTDIDAGDPPLDLVVWMAAQVAEALLTAAATDRWRICPGATCGWIFVDTTRNGRRRWCEMATCGTRAKDRRRRGPLRTQRRTTIEGGPA